MKNSLEFLYSLRNQGSKFGIERMEAFCRALGNPQHSFPVIHVAGTNGKGSVCAMLDSIYRAHGYRVGLFTSPHLLELGERIRVDGKNMHFSKIEAWVGQLLSTVADLEKEEAGMSPTFFEFITVIAFLEFKKQKVDLAIFETGLGGRLDSTNVVIPELSIITTVGYDHCEILGDTLTEIASEKAGIIKPGKPVVVGWMEKEAEQVVDRVAREKEAPLYRMNGTKQSDLPRTNLKGSFQQKNAALANQAVQLLNRRLPTKGNLVLEALQRVKLSGRWQKICSEPTIILDACHNGEGARVSTELWDQLPEDCQIWFAACGLDRAREVLSPLLKRSKRITLFELNQPRSCSLQDFKKLTETYQGLVTFAKENQVPQLCQQLDRQTTLLVTGSIYLIGSFLSHFQKINRPGIHSNWQDHW